MLGRWPGERLLRYAVQQEDGDPDLAATVAAAAAIWNATGVVQLRAATAEEGVDLVFSFEEGDHGDCAPFGVNAGVAHAGAPRPPSYVHFHRLHDWTVGEQGDPLLKAATHELGHVLGLGHTADPEALMYPVPQPGQPALGAGDLAGLHSLYGGGGDGPGDVVIRRESGEPVAVLRGVAPRETCDLGVLDTDGDGAEELLVWRTDREGHGALTIYRFTAGPGLAATQGPIPGMVLPGVPHRTAVTAEGERLLVSLQEDGRWQARVFDERGLPGPRLPGEPLVLDDRRDEDGDGRWDAAAPRAETPSSWSADLDGDGERERLIRR